jgi:hypothetical protein
MVKLLLWFTFGFYWYERQTDWQANIALCKLKIWCYNIREIQYRKAFGFSSSNDWWRSLAGYIMYYCHDYSSTVYGSTTLVGIGLFILEFPLSNSDKPLTLSITTGTLRSLWFIRSLFQHCVLKTSKTLFLKHLLKTSVDQRWNSNMFRTMYVHHQGSWWTYIVRNMLEF